MFPPSVRASTRSLSLLTAALIFGCLAPATPAQTAPAPRGKLKDNEGPRQLAPVVEAASDEGQQALSRMKLPAGLTSTLWAAEPMLANPVSFNLDELGRVFVTETHRYRTSTLDIRDYMWMLEDDLANRNQADFLASIKRNFGDAGIAELSKESERVVLIEDTNHDGVADKSSVYADNFRSPLDGIASGVLAHRGQVWFTNIPALWKFTGHDKAETRTELFRGFGLRFNFTGHDFHGLILGPDGRIYCSIGDRGANVTTAEGQVLDSADTGSVFRCWPDGSGLEIFATGLRNPQSLAFNEYGDLFTGDNDSDQGDEERLVHLVEGGDSGWRIGYQHAPRGNAGPWNAEKLWRPRHAAQPAYLLPPICNIEDGPSGIAYYPGTGLTPAYAGNLFITHFKGSPSNSGIYTYKLKPAGASYAIATAAPFLTGALPTDVRFGPDGKLYYSDWAEGWPKSKKGRIYTIADPKRANDPLVQETRQLIAGDWSKKSSDELARLLGHPDWRVRLEAQSTLAEQGAAGLATLRTVLASSDIPAFAHLHTLWALGQIARTNPDALATLRSRLTLDDREFLAQTIKTLGDLRDAASAGTFVTALTDANPRVRFFAAQALGKIKHAEATPALVAALRANNDTDAYLRHALVMGLAGCATPAQLAATTTDDSRSVRLAAVLALRRLGHADVAKFLTDKDPLIVREAAEAINDAPVAAAYPALAAFLAKPTGDEPVMLRAVNAAFRLGTPAQAAALAAYVAQGWAPANARREALVLLSQWPAPPARDRLVGIYRPLAEKTRDPAIASAALQPHVPALVAAHTPDSVQIALCEALIALKATDALAALRLAVADPAQSGSVRAAALTALDRLGDPALAEAVATALASGSADLRLTALPISSRLAPEKSLDTLKILLAKGTGQELQTAYRALGGAQGTAVDDLLLAELKRLDAGAVAPAAQLDLLDAAALRPDPRIKQVLAARDAALAKNPDPLAPFRVALEGGNGPRAYGTFTSHPVMQCFRCHRVGPYGGGEAGPELGNIGTRATREYILESIIKPSAKIADGYGIVTVTKKNGGVVIGTLLHRDAETLRLKTGDADPVVIPAAEVKTVDAAPSAMPEVAALVLTKSEIRDLVELLAGFKYSVHAPGATPVPRALRNPTDQNDTPSPAGGH